MSFHLRQGRRDWPLLHFNLLQAAVESLLRINKPISLSCSSWDLCSFLELLQHAPFWRERLITGQRIRGVASPVLSTEDDHSPVPAGHTFADPGWDAICLLGTAGSCSAAVNQHPQVSVHWAALLPQACIGAWDYCDPSAGPGTSPYADEFLNTWIIWKSSINFGPIYTTVSLDQSLVFLTCCSFRSFSGRLMSETESWKLLGLFRCEEMQNILGVFLVKIVRAAGSCRSNAMRGSGAGIGSCQPSQNRFEEECTAISRQLQLHWAAAFLSRLGLDHGGLIGLLC